MMMVARSFRVADNTFINAIQKNEPMEIIEELLQTIQRNSIDNISTITNVSLFVDSWRKELNLNKDMKAILEFNMDNQDDALMHQNAIKADSMYSLIWDMSQKFRTKIKYAPDEMDPSYLKALEDMREDFISLIHEHHLEFILD